MCEIAGFLDFKQRLGEPEALALAPAMADHLTHRGPDAGGAGANAAAGIRFGRTAALCRATMVAQPPSRRSADCTGVRS